VFFRDAWNCALFAFTLNTAAYQAEILRGAIESVTRGQHEGAAALGLTRFQTFRKIILPQAMIVALRPYGNEIILMIKGSAIVAIVTVFDLMGETRRAYLAHLRFPDLYLGGGVLPHHRRDPAQHLGKARTAAHAPPQAIVTPIAACRARAFV
jgi:ABC-type arginine/histidine transport system permease subunit